MAERGQATGFDEEELLDVAIWLFWGARLRAGSRSTPAMLALPTSQTITLEAPADADRVSAFLDIRVADIEASYKWWSECGAEFLAPPINNGPETRCYLHDPDGHLIEVGQSNPE